MQQRKFNSSVFKVLGGFSEVVANGNRMQIKNELCALAKNPLFKGKAWQDSIMKFVSVLLHESPVYSVFVKGNSKLPFYSFSALPGVTCPGAGECLEFCYSFRSWRYPAAFFRQCQNTYLLRTESGKRNIALAMADLKKGSSVRLYVDGDFDSVRNVSYWMHTIRENPSLNVYGYSKSFTGLLTYSKMAKFPDNYTLNISSGHNADNLTLQAVKSLPIVRGEFVAVSIGNKVKAKDYGTKRVNDAIRAKFAESVKVFPCPGKCGTCTSVGHACGNQTLFKGKIIAIAVH
jgi:hypothetical protein